MANTTTNTTKLVRQAFSGRQDLQERIADAVGGYFFWDFFFSPASSKNLPTSPPS
jgi:hypothetical protein